jgi:NTP pyrophosphatase (non-canonical NTP hydrolase)
MNFTDYQALSSRTAPKNADKVNKGQNLANFGMGLCGEAGEVTDYLKKVVFHKHELDKEKLIDELGDVLWYISQIAHVAKIDMNDIAEYNIDKLKRRYPEGFSTERSVNRD